jgi:UDP-glucose 4-epimerase
MSRFIAMALKDKDITIYGDGLQKRTFCYIDDNVDACVNAAIKNQYINDVVNVGTDFEISILDLAKKIIQLTKSKSRIVHLPPLKEGDMLRRFPDIDKMRNLLNRELVPMDEGIKKVLSDQHFATSII